MISHLVALSLVLARQGERVSLEASRKILQSYATEIEQAHSELGEKYGYQSAKGTLMAAGAKLGVDPGKRNYYDSWNGWLYLAWTNNRAFYVAHDDYLKQSLRIVERMGFCFKADLDYFQEAMPKWRKWDREFRKQMANIVAGDCVEMNAMQQQDDATKEFDDLDRKAITEAEKKLWAARRSQRMNQLQQLEERAKALAASGESRVKEISESVRVFGPIIEGDSYQIISTVGDDRDFAGRLNAERQQDVNRIFVQIKDVEDKIKLLIAHSENLNARIQNAETEFVAADKKLKDRRADYRKTSQEFIAFSERPIAYPKGVESLVKMRDSFERELDKQLRLLADPNFGPTPGLYESISSTTNQIDQLNARISAKLPADPARQNAIAKFKASLQAQDDAIWAALGEVNRTKSEFELVTSLIESAGQTRLERQRELDQLRQDLGKLILEGTTPEVVVESISGRVKNDLVYFAKAEVSNPKDLKKEVDRLTQETDEARKLLANADDIRAQARLDNAEAQAEVLAALETLSGKVKPGRWNVWSGGGGKIMRAAYVKAAISTAEDFYEIVVEGGAEGGLAGMFGAAVGKLAESITEQIAEKTKNDPDPYGIADQLGTAYESAYSNPTDSMIRSGATWVTKKSAEAGAKWVGTKAGNKILGTGIAAVVVEVGRDESLGRLQRLGQLIRGANAKARQAIKNISKEQIKDVGKTGVRKLFKILGDWAVGKVEDEFWVRMAQKDIVARTTAVTYLASIDHYWNCYDQYMTSRQKLRDAQDEYDRALRGGLTTLTSMPFGREGSLFVTLAVRRVQDGRRYEIQVGNQSLVKSGTGFELPISSFERGIHRDLVLKMTTLKDPR